MAQLLLIQVFLREPPQTLMTGSKIRLQPKKNQHQALKRQRASKRLRRLMSSQKQTPQMRLRQLRMINQQKRHLKERVLRSEESSKSY